MTLKEAFIEIKEEGYDVRYINDHALQIDFDILFDAYNCCFVILLETEGKLLLTDYAEYEEIMVEHDENEEAKICEKYGVILDGCYIEKDYHSPKDIELYIECIKELADHYSIDA